MDRSPERPGIVLPSNGAPSPPPVLYKYLPPERIDVLRNRRIRFSPISDLNDPFESRPLVRADHASAMRRALEESGDVEAAKQKAADFAEHVKDHGAEYVWTAIDESFGVLSLSAIADQPVMWGLYADAYRGLVIGLHSQHAWFHSTDSHGSFEHAVYPVHYQDDRPAILLPANLAEADPEEFTRGTILTKSMSWAFEREWRLWNPRRNALDPSECAGVSDLYPFPEDLVAEVILGPRTHDEIQAEVIELLSSEGYENVKLVQARLGRTTFRIELVEASDSMRG